MIKSNSIGELAKALSQFQSKIEAIKKTADNPFFKSKFADLSSIIADIRKPLSDEGLSYSQFPTGTGGLTTILMHNSGEFLEETFFMTPDKNTAQAVGSCITYMRRYSLGAILGLATEEDDDAEKATDHAKEDGIYEKAVKAISIATTKDRLDFLQDAFNKKKELTPKEQTELTKLIKAKSDGLKA